ncbi:MAG: hypothetical protein ACRENS_06200, partial [Candidatus Eiseniibacteriota bacterium]
SLQPSFGVDPNGHALGIAALARNNTLFRSVPVSLSAAYRWATTGTTHRNKFQISGMYEPPLGALAKPLSMTVLGDYGWIEGGSTSGEISAECDWSLSQHANSYVGAAVYYDRQHLSGAGSPGGATVGITSGVAFDPSTELSGEYDFESDFSGEDSWSAQLARVLMAAPKLTLVLGVQKHSSILAAIRANLPELRRRHRS